jgi:hypothetical protein
MGSNLLLGWSFPNTSGVVNVDIRTSTQHKLSCGKPAENGVAITSYCLDLPLQMLAVRGPVGSCSITTWSHFNKAQLSCAQITNRTQFWRTPGISTWAKSVSVSNWPHKLVDLKFIYIRSEILILQDIIGRYQVYLDIIWTNQQRAHLCGTVSVLFQSSPVTVLGSNSPFLTL